VAFRYDCARSLVTKYGDVNDEGADKFAPHGSFSLWPLLATLDALEIFSEKGCATRLGGHPGSYLPGRIVTHMLRMAALEVRDPMPFLILMEADDSPGNRRPRAYISLHIEPAAAG
jgi:hypothetical protein